MGKLTKGVLLVGGAAVALGAGAYLYYKKQVEKLTSKEFEDLENEEPTGGIYFDADSFSNVDFRSEYNDSTETDSLLKDDDEFIDDDDDFEDEFEDFVDDGDFEEDDEFDEEPLDIKSMGLECVSSTKELLSKVGSLLSHLANSKTMTDEEKQAYCKEAVTEIKEVAKKSGNAYATYTLNKTADILDGFEAFLDMSKEVVDKKAKEFADKGKSNSEKE